MASTTLTSWAILVWKALQSHGHDANAIFKRSGLNTALLGDGNARYRISDMVKLWQEVVAETSDPCFGLEVGKEWSTTSFHALGFAWLASSSLKDALQRLTRYSKIVNSSLNASLETHGTTYHLIISSDEDPALVHPAAGDAGLAAIIVMCRLLCGDSFVPDKIELIKSRLPCATRIEAFVRKSIEYECPRSLMVVDRRFAEQRLLTGNAQLARINEEAASHYLAKVERSSFTVQVKNKIIQLMPSGNVTEEQVASLLNLSLRTLQRKLEEENTSYSALSRSLRKEMAYNYIQDSQLSINEIAYLLGFAEQANFSRAFRRWYGESPTEYRKLSQMMGSMA